MTIASLPVPPAPLKLRTMVLYRCISIKKKKKKKDGDDDDDDDDDDEYYLQVVAVEAACYKLEWTLLLSGAGRTESGFSGFDNIVLWRRGAVEV